MGENTDIVVRDVGGEQGPEIVDILAEAFSADPVMNWISRDETYPKQFFEWAMPFFSVHRNLYLAGSGSASEGALVCLPAGAAMEIPFASVLGMSWRHGLGSLRRVSALLKTMEDNHPARPHYYVFALGVRRQCQGRGVGSALLRHVLQACDREGLPAYLENSNPRNLALYERHGFKGAARLDLPRGEARLWPMWREPCL